MDGLGQIRAVVPQGEKFHMSWCFVVWNERNVSFTVSDTLQ